MNIRFIGSETGLNTFKKLLMGKANVSGGNDAKDALIFEVSSLEMLYKIPKRSFGVPVFFYLTTPNKTVISNIKDYNISGILYPPLNADAIMNKLIMTKEHTVSTVNAKDYETLRIKIIAKAENIPTLPAIAQDLINLTRNHSQTAIGQITSKIKTDQGISSKVIKLVNSPFYGVRQEIASIDRATMLLGFSSVKNIALAISLDQYYQKPFNMYKTTGQTIWKHAYKVALMSSEIAKFLNQDTDALYMAGLMHDIGKVVMADFLVREVDNVMDEREQLGCDHAEIASFILNKWSVAPMVVEAVKTHHDNNADLYGRIVATANKIDHDKPHYEEHILQLNKDFPVPNVEKLVESIQCIVRDNTDDTE